MDILANIDIAVFYFINGTCHNGLLDAAVPFVTELGAREFIFGVAVLLMVLGRKKIRMSGVLLLAGLTLTYYIGSFLKGLIARPRPFMVLDNVNTLFPAGNFSFPSNHATIAFMSAFVMTRYFRRWYAFYPAAVLVALSRVYLGVHYPSDVLAGALLGSIIGYVLTRAEKNSE